MGCCGKNTSTRDLVQSNYRGGSSYRASSSPSFYVMNRVVGKYNLMPGLLGTRDGPRMPYDLKNMRYIAPQLGYKMPSKPQYLSDNARPSVAYYNTVEYLGL